MDLKLNVPEVKDVKAVAVKSVKWFDSVLQQVGDEIATKIIKIAKEQEAKRKETK